jgi:type II secretory pathway pseudopilin PulG
LEGVTGVDGHRLWRKYSHTSLGDERGETFVEILVTVVIVGMAAVAIMGALMTTIGASTEHRNLTTNDAIVKSALESVKYQVELAPIASADFLDCEASPQTPVAILNDWTTPGNPHAVALPTPPSGYTVTITGVECWNPTLNTGAGGFDPNCTDVNGAVNVAACGPNDTSGMQRVTVTATDPSGYKVRLSSLVRNPAYETSYSALY